MRVKRFVRAVDGVSFKLARGKTFSLVGESGSGKTTLAKTVTRIYEPTGGKILFDGIDISKLKGKELKLIRRQIGVVFQDIDSSLNPRRRVKDIIAAPLEIYKWGSRRERVERVRRLLNLVELPSEEYMYRYSRAISGGEKQRVGIARALALNPQLVVLDEPTSALDVSVQAKILNLLKRLQGELHLLYILISHDLSVVRNVTDRIGVMYLGKIVEMATVDELFRNPLHPYTKVLLSCIPTVTDKGREIIPERMTLEGEIPSPFNIPSGCSFHNRCPFKIGQICESKEPKEVAYTRDHLVSCHLYY